MKTHGKSATPIYRRYRDMRNRCENPRRLAFKDYGARGIKVCERWKSFENFYADMGDPPSLKHELDRIDPNGDYEPGNVRWATDLEQANNRRNTRYVEYRGQKMPLTDAARLAGSIIHWEAAWARIESGWAVENALETPPQFRSANANDRDWSRCIHGHELTPENTYLEGTARRCRACIRQRLKKSKAKKREAARASDPARVVFGIRA